MCFCYTVISRGNTPLVQHCTETGNFDLYYQKFLSTHPTDEGVPTIIQYDNLNWGILRENKSLSFLCVVHIDYSEDVIKKMLEAIRFRFLRYHSNDWENARTFAFQSDFQPKLVEITSKLQKMSTKSYFTPPPFDIQLAQFDSLSTSVPLSTSSSTYDPQPSWFCKPWPIFITSLNMLIMIYIVLMYACHGLTLSRCWN